MSFGYRLKMLRTSKKMTQTELGNILNVTKSSISGYENGTRFPDQESLVKIADYFDVTTDYLLGKKQTPEWASDDQVIELDKILKSKAGMAYGSEGEISEEDREAIDDLIAGYFWQKKRKEKRKK
ncbi:helix-turn-helix domain-containing protein [Enterococcus sp. UD-01]|jgi:transcriptional regulator with XRE-family HTH domain|uniref:helix-turn-helix domain-containing protein n=1 Tax=Enterococcus sp. UD-01 TaxID=3373911 RepID=UPI003836177A